MAAAELSIHLDLDGAWEPSDLPMRTLDFRDWGPRLRYFAAAAAMERLDHQLPRHMPPFLLYGSGDFHHLAALWLRRALTAAESGGDVTVVSFDNHPDWDRRPPRWSCGGWVNRVLELAGVNKVHVWGCGNFELKYPSRLFANHAALDSGRLVVHPWAERHGPDVQSRFRCMNRQNWKEQFRAYAAGLGNANVYVTVDLDCLEHGSAMTNWESGLFTPEDLAWAIEELRSAANIIAGDVCGAYSPLVCAGVFRRLASWWDHPKLVDPTLAEARRINGAAIGAFWPALAQAGQ